MLVKVYVLDAGGLLVSIFNIDFFISSFWYLDTIWVVSSSILYIGLLVLLIWVEVYVKEV